MKRMNRDGPAIMGSFPVPERTAETRLPALLKSGAVVVDLRSAGAFAAGHIPGTINLPLNRNFATYAGSLLPYDRDLYLLTGGGPGFIGLERIAGYLGPEALEVWADDQGPLERLPQVAPAELAAMPGGVFLLDVRGESEWAGGHLANATLIPLPELSDRMGEVPSDQPVVVQCQSGSRSSIAASLLRARGRQARNLAGGFSAWTAAGLPYEK
jgi:hydroxyacylglutathione hydrolase